MSLRKIEAHLDAPQSSSAQRHVDHVSAFSTATDAVKTQFVRCPRTEGSVPVSRCLSCSAAAMLIYDKTGALERIECRHPDAPRSRADLLLKRTTVGELMTRNVVCVRPELGIDDAVQLFVETGLKAVPVVLEQGTVLGMVEEADVVLAAQVHAADRDDARRTVGDVMMPVSFALHEQVSASQAAGLMVYESVHRVPVVSSEGRVVGLLSASDLLSWVARADGYVLPERRQVTVPNSRRGG
jgi:CBS domain-containing protein